MVFPNGRAGREQQFLAVFSLVEQEMRGFFHQRPLYIRGERRFVHPAGHQALHLLAQDAVVKLRFSISGCSEGPADDLKQGGRLNSIVTVFPAAGGLPVVKAVQKVRGQQFIVVGDGQTARVTWCIKGNNDHICCLGQVLFPAGEGLTQLRLILAGIGRPLGAAISAAHRTGHFGYLDALGIPAQEGSPTKWDTLVGHQPPQGIVSLLGGGIAHRRGLPSGVKSASKRKALFKIGRAHV